MRHLIASLSIVFEYTILLLQQNEQDYGSSNPGLNFDYIYRIDAITSDLEFRFIPVATCLHLFGEKDL